MSYSISVTFDLDDYDQKTYKYCQDNQYDVPDYTTLLDRIQGDIEQLDGVDMVIFDHSSWVRVDLGISCFDTAREETEVIMNEIRQVFVKHGVIL